MKKAGFLLLILLCVSAYSTLLRAEEYPSDSLYQINSSWENMQGETLKWPALAGKIQLVAFVYTHCLNMCPLIVADMKKVFNRLTEKQRQNVRFTLISLDPNKDTPAVMLEFMATHQLDVGFWQFLRASPEDTQELALLFDIRYRQTGDEIAHSNTISVLDQSGRLVHQRLGAGGLDLIADKLTGLF